MLYLAPGLDAKLHIVAIGPIHNAYALDLLCGKGFNALLGIAHQTQSPDATAIGERDVFPVLFQLPSGLLVFDRAVIMLKAGIALLAWLVVLAIVIEVGDSKPGTICTGLPGLGIEARGKGILFGKGGTVAVKIVLCRMLIHPKTKTLIADELYYADSFIDGSVLLFVAIELVLVDEHPACPFTFVLLY